MPIIQIAPTGKLIKGSVLDVNAKLLEQALKFYDKQLYTEWNPRKNGGWGCWEIRRRPEYKTVIKVGNFNGMNLYRLEYWESDMANHILDLPRLDYNVLTYLKKIDTWKQSGNWVDNLEKKRLAYEEEVRQKNNEDLRYRLRQNKRLLRDFKEAVASGYSPFDFFRGQYDD